jgi:hypothetical protein
MTVECGYCNVAAELVNGDLIYPWRFDLHNLKFWRCPTCGAYTGTHAGSPGHKPKGGLANQALRQARISAHAVFDIRWRSGKMTRKAAYSWLREQLGCPTTPHIGFMDEAQCKRVVELCTGHER